MIFKDDIAVSMTVLVFASVFAVVCLILWVAKRHRMKSTNPPCMSSIPVLGSLPFISEVPQLHLFFFETIRTSGESLLPLHGQQVNISFIVLQFLFTYYHQILIGIHEFCHIYNYAWEYIITENY